MTNTGEHNRRLNASHSLRIMQVQTQDTWLKRPTDGRVSGGDVNINPELSSLTGPSLTAEVTVFDCLVGVLSGALRVSPVS